MTIVSLKELIKMMLPAKWRLKLRELAVSKSIKHLHGPKKLWLSGNEAVVTCLVKNGEFYIEQFIRHYTQMGFRHIFILDNSSSDQTISIAKSHKNISIYQSDLPVSVYQGLLKKYLAESFMEGGWCLDVDIDEFFDYPGSAVIKLNDFISYLNRNQYTAVITQMLDMFSDKTVSYMTNKQEGELKEIYQYYDLSNITKVEYQRADLANMYGLGNTITNEKSALYFGGIRKTLYGNDCLLTKHSLFLMGKGLQLFPHVHFVNNAKLADVTCLLNHYKLTSNALETAMQNREKFTANSDSYGEFIEFLKKNPDYKIKQKTSKKFGNVNDMIENSFLFISEEYRKYSNGLAQSNVFRTQ